MLASFCSSLRDFQETLLKSAWGMLDTRTKNNLENQLNCCGLLNTTACQLQFDQDFQNCTAVSLTSALFFNDSIPQQVGSQ